MLQTPVLAASPLLIRRSADRLADGLVTVALAIGLAGFTGLFIWCALTALVRAGLGDSLVRPASPFFLAAMGLYLAAGFVGSLLTTLILRLGGLLLRRTTAGNKSVDDESLVVTRKMSLEAMACALGIKVAADPGAEPGTSDFVGPDNGRTAITISDLKSARLLVWLVFATLMTAIIFAVERLA